MKSRGATTDDPASHPSALSRAEARVGFTINDKWPLDALLAVSDTASVDATDINALARQSRSEIPGISRAHPGR